MITVSLDFYTVLEMRRNVMLCLNEYFFKNKLLTAEAELNPLLSM